MVISKMFITMELMLQTGIGVTQLLWNALEYIRGFQNLVHILAQYQNTKRSVTLKKMENEEIPNLLKKFDKLMMVQEPKSNDPAFMMARMSSFAAIRKAKLEMNIGNLMNESIKELKENDRITKEQAVKFQKHLDEMEKEMSKISSMF